MKLLLLLTIGAAIAAPCPAQDNQSQSAQSVGTSSAADVDADNAGHEVEFFVAGSIGLDGRSLGRPMMNAGARFGWLLTDRHSNRFYDGRFEFGLEFDPLFVVGQQGGPAYGFDFYPVVVKWNFKPHRRLQPYFEFAGGGLITNKDIPPGINSFNFTPTASAGIRILRGKYAWSIGFRYLHISDARLTYPNPGDDTVGLRISFNRWLK